MVIIYLYIASFSPYELGKAQDKRQIDISYETRHQLESYDKIEPDNDE